MYMVGMIRFYVTLEWGIGGEMLARAAQRNHGPALFQCAIALMNGSGGSGRLDADLEGANELLFQAMALGYMPAGVELGARMIRGLGTRAEAKGIDVVKLVKAEKFREVRALAEGLIRKEKYPFSSSFLPASFLVDWSRKTTPEPASAERQAGWRLLAAAAHKTLRANDWRRDVIPCGNRKCGRVAPFKNLKDEFVIRCPYCVDIRYCSIACKACDVRRHLGELEPLDRFPLGFSHHLQ